MPLFKPRSLRSAIGFSFGFTIVSKMVGYGRQWLLAYKFGVSRDVDIYMMAYGIAMLSVFPFTVWFDQLVLPQLVMVREKKGETAFQRLSAAAFTFSLLVAIGMALVFAAWVPAGSWLLGHGFKMAERAEVRYFAFYFIPWVLIIFPYNALSVILKSLRYYDIVLSCDFVVSLVGTLGFALSHRHLITLPLSLAAGYMLSTMILFWRASRLTRLWGSPGSDEMRGIYRNVRRMMTLYPLGFIQSSIDRFFQSYLAPGAIAACGYAGQLVSPAIELLAFDESFIVPLSSTEGRGHKVHRLLAGLILCTIPLVIFLIWKAPALISVLFEYGHFDQHALSLATAIFRLLVITVCTSTLTTPLVRLLQISDHIYQTSYLLLSNAVLGLLFNLIFVGKLHWSVTGTTMAIVLATCGTLLTGIITVTRAGYAIQGWRLAKYGGWAFLSSAIALVMARHLPSSPVALFNLLIAGAAFWILLALFYWPVRGQIRFILYG